MNAYAKERQAFGSPINTYGQVSSYCNPPYWLYERLQQSRKIYIPELDHSTLKHWTSAIR